jgi:hypothetical protein
MAIASLVSLCVSFLLLSCETALGAESHNQKMLLTQDQAEALAEKIKEHTPENVHAKGATLQWVYLTFGKEIPGNLRRAMIKVFSKYYVVYLSEKRIPFWQIYRDRGKIAGFKDGFQFTLGNVNYKNHHTIEVSFSDWIGNLGASGRTVAYSWDGNAWIVLDKGIMWIS